MSTTSTVLAEQPVASGTVARIAHFAAGLAETFREARAAKKARSELMALDDRMLRDIGLDRSEIASAVLNPNCERINGSAGLKPAR
ncbi:MAG: DUF1127 domain-containing protein [Hyphomicrobiaceae bacterium]